MDGHRIPHRSARLAPAAALLLAAAALAFPALGSAALADDAPPADVRWPVDGPAVQTAMQIAQDHWGFAPCQGHVQIAWEDLDPSLDALSQWANPYGEYSRPLENSSCEISLSPRGQWDWPKLCTILVHEVGHLTGHDHSADPDDVMYFSYVRPFPACAATPEPEPAPPPAPPAPPAATAPAAPPAVAPKPGPDAGRSRHPRANRPATAEAAHRSRSSRHRRRRAQARRRARHAARRQRVRARTPRR